MEEMIDHEMINSADKWQEKKLLEYIKEFD